MGLVYSQEKEYRAHYTLTRFPMSCLYTCNVTSITAISREGLRSSLGEVGLSQDHIKLVEDHVCWITNAENREKYYPERMNSICIYSYNAPLIEIHQMDVAEPENPDKYYRLHVYERRE